MNDYRFSVRSRRNLFGVHPDLVMVAAYALTVSRVDFAVVSGLRTMDHQRELVASGASWTMESRHLTGHAVDILPYVPGRDVSKSWPHYYMIADAMLESSRRWGISVHWGGDWRKRDGPHWYLSKESYPASSYPIGSQSVAARLHTRGATNA